MPSPDISLLKPGSRVKLRGDAKPQPRKPYPRGWKTVAAIDGPRDIDGDLWEVTAIRVDEDERWLPVSLIEEIVP